MPKRIRLSRTPGWRIADHSDNYVIVDRRSKWGNPFRVQSITATDGKKWYVSGLNTPRTYVGSREEAREKAVNLYRRWLRAQLHLGFLDLSELRGKDLACWCPLDSPCHADILLEFLARTPNPARIWEQDRPTGEVATPHDVLAAFESLRDGATNEVVKQKWDELAELQRKEIEDGRED